MTLPFTSIISDDIIVITFNVTIADDTIITVITTGTSAYNCILSPLLEILLPRS